jgi:hypothetical protein
MSPEGIAYAMDAYIASLNHQVAVAKAFYLGRLGRGIEGLLSLPADVRDRIDELIWEVSQGEPIDPTEVSSQDLITQAILYNVEERMGMHEVML